MFLKDFGSTDLSIISLLFYMYAFELQKYF